MRRLGWVGALVALGCSPPANMAADEGTETGGSDEAPEDGSMDMQAVVYAVSSLDSAGGAYYLRRLGDEPILLGASESHHVDRLCLQPDGTGYVRWLPRTSHREDRLYMESFAIGDDWVESGGPSPFPPGLVASGCPMGWTPDAYFVNLATDETLADGRPYRVLPDGTAHPMLEADSSWFSAGDYVIETNLEQTVLWMVEGAVPRVARTFDGSVGVERMAGWTILEHGDERIELLSPTKIGQDPIPLFGPPTPGTVHRWYWISASGDGVATADYDEDWGVLSLDLLQIEDGVLIQRHRLGAEPGMDWDPTITDSGRMVVAGDGAVWTAWFGEGLTAIPVVEGEVLRVAVSEDEDVVIVEQTPDGSQTAYAVHDLRNGSSRDLHAPPSCELHDAVGEYGYFICDDSRFERVNLRGAELQFESLESLTPFIGAEPHRVRHRPWNGESWHSLSYTIEGSYDGGVSVLLRADGTARLEIPHSNSSGASSRLFPVDADTW